MREEKETGKVTDRGSHTPWRWRDKRKESENEKERRGRRHRKKRDTHTCARPTRMARRGKARKRSTEKSKQKKLPTRFLLCLFFFLFCFYFSRGTGIPPLLFSPFFLLSPLSSSSFPFTAYRQTIGTKMKRKDKQICLCLPREGQRWGGKKGEKKGH